MPNQSQILLAPDLQAQQENLARRQAMANMLMQRGANSDYSTQMVGNVAVQRSPWEGLANLGAAYFGRKMADENQTQQQKIAEAIRVQQDHQFQSMYGGGQVQPQQVPVASIAQQLYGQQTPAGQESNALIPQMQQVQQPQQQSSKRFVTGSEAGDRYLHAQNPEEYFKAWNAINNAEYSTTPEFDEQGRAYVMNKAGGRQFIGSNRQEKIVNDNGVLRSEYGTAPRSVINDPNKPFGYKLENGLLKVSPNNAVQGYELTKAETGSTKINMPVSVNTEKTYSGNVASGLAQKDIDAVELGRSAVQSVYDAQNILKTLDTKKAIVGPLAGAKMTAQQIGTLFGLEGDGSVEQTRGMMQSMAKLVLQARKQMSGQGQITDKESALAERTAAGDISMTAPEIAVLAKAAERASRVQIKRAQSIQNKWNNDPNMGTVGKDMDIQEPPAYKSQTQSTNPHNITFNPKTGKWE